MRVKFQTPCKYFASEKVYTGLNLVQYSDHHLKTRLLNVRQVNVCYSDISISFILRSTHAPNPTVTVEES